MSEGSATAVAGVQSTAGRVRGLLLASLPDALLHGGLLLSVLFLLLAVPHFIRGGAEELVANLVHHAHAFTVLMAVSILGRTLPLRTIAAFFFVGLFPAVFLALLVSGAVAGVVRDDRMLDSLLVPLVEEGVKAVPLIAFFWLSVRRGWQPSITDGVVLGFAIGAGMAIHEDGLYQRVYAEGSGESLLHLIFPTLGSQSTLSRVEVNGFYHSGWGSLIGLGIGTWFSLRWRYRWAFLLGLGAFLLAAFDHAIGNFIITSLGPRNLGALWTLDLEGMLPVLVVLIGVAAAAVGEVLLLRRMAREDQLLPGQSLQAALSGLGPTLDGLLRLQAARNYSRARRALHYLVWAGRGTPDPVALDRQMGRVAAPAGRLGMTLLRWRPDR
jgi:RsiW-degrading membrane proteinase PrsW (M82 family)